MGEEGQVTLTGGKAVTAGTVRESGNREAKTSVAWGLKSSGAGNLRRTAGGCWTEQETLAIHCSKGKVSG